ncbi:unnamed protein product, partial [Musa hybrid cultivar]
RRATIKRRVGNGGGGNRERGEEGDAPGGGAPAQGVRVGSEGRFRTLLSLRLLPEMNIIGYINLKMNQNISWYSRRCRLLQHLENEFDALKEEHESLEEACRTPEESKASDRRKHNLRKREIKQGI